MDIFGTVAAAIGLAAKIKATFEQAGYNKSDSVTLCSDIAKSLSGIEDYLKQLPASPSSGLRDNLSELESELRIILRRLDREYPTSKLKAVYNAGDIKHELAQLRQKVQMCEQNLQRSCVVSTSIEVSTINQQVIEMREKQESMDRHLQMLVDKLGPSSSPERMATLDQIETNIQNHISVIDTNGTLGQELERIRTTNLSKVALSTRTAKLSLRSVSSSIVARGYLKRRVHELANTLPQLRNQVLMPSPFIWLGNPFYKLAVWEGDSPSKCTREDAIRETLRILSILRSNQKISYLNAAKDLLGLGRALGALGMHKESGVMYDWGVQICRELVAAGNSKRLFGLAKFLYKLFVDLSNRGQLDDAQRVLEQAVEVRVQLEKQDHVAYLSKLALSLHGSGYALYMAKRYGDAAKNYKEVVTIRRGLVERSRDIYLPDLAGSLDGLGVTMDKAGRWDDAVKNHQEAVEMRRELVEKNRVAHLSDLAKSLWELGVNLHRVGRYEDTVKSHQESVTMRRELVERNRAVHLPDLGLSLCELGVTLHTAGRSEDGARIIQESVTVRQELVKKNRDTYLPELGRSLETLGVSMAHAGRYDDAVKNHQDAIVMRRELVDRNRAIYLPELALSLWELGVALSGAGRYEDAVKIHQESIVMRREC